MADALTELPNGTVVLLAANIFIYGFLSQSEQCTRLIERCRNEEVLGITTTEVISEVCHRLMLREAMDTGLIGRPAASILKSKQDGIRRLHKYWELTSRIYQFDMMILPSDPGRQHNAQRIRSEYGLLTNDSLIAAAALEYGIRALASRDSDFNRIPELTIYEPSDLPF